MILNSGTQNGRSRSEQVQRDKNKSNLHHLNESGSLAVDKEYLYSQKITAFS